MQKYDLFIIYIQIIAFKQESKTVNFFNNIVVILIVNRCFVDFSIQNFHVHPNTDILYKVLRAKYARVRYNFSIL